MCGEYLSERDFESKWLGSPPHVWEIRNNGFNVKLIDRITPHIWGIPYENPHISTTCEGMNEYNI